MKMTSKYDSKSKISGKQINKGDDIVFIKGFGAFLPNEVNQNRLNLLEKIEIPHDYMIKHFINASKVKCVEKDNRFVGYIEGQDDIPYNYAIQGTKLIESNKGNDEKINKIVSEYGYDYFYDC